MILAYDILLDFISNGTLFTSVHIIGNFYVSNVKGVGLYC